MGKKYVYLLAVWTTGQKLVAAEADADHQIEAGDLVEYDAGKIGKVVACNFVDKDGDDYAFFTMFHAPVEVTAHWSRSWHKEENNAS